MARSILDLMTPDERDRALKKAEKRLSKGESKSVAISPELYIIGEIGFYYGWDAVLAIRRGYTVGYARDERGNFIRKDGKLVEEPEIFTLEEATTLVEAARKVGYSKLIEQAHSQMVASASKFAKNSGQAFENGMRPFAERAKVKE